jgi:peptidyl-prolyl cis-trans isomerase-like 4
LKYYHGCKFFNVQQTFLVQSGDPSNTGSGGESVFTKIHGQHSRFFSDEISTTIRHDRRGRLGMANAGAANTNASQFYITTGDSAPSLDGKATIFGEVAEGFDSLERIDSTPVDSTNRPWQNIRILKEHVLDDPFDDPPGLEAHIPDKSPEIVRHEDDDRLEDDWEPGNDDRPPEEVEKESRRKEAKSRAVLLEMIGDVPDADMKPPENMLFVCKLNPVTTDEDLEIIFSRFGTVTSCDIVRDHKTGDSLQYAFVGFADKKAAEQAYFRMNNVLVDDRRIVVDFSQSAYQLWQAYRRKGKRRGTQEDKQAAASAENQKDKIETKEEPHEHHERQQRAMRSKSRERRKGHATAEQMPGRGGRSRLKSRSPSRRKEQGRSRKRSTSR